MLENAHILTAKIANAEGGDLYDIRKENVAIILKVANSLMLHNHSLKDFGFEHVDYYSMVRALIEEYRILFIDWVTGFDKMNYMIYRWGLFNPPELGPFDLDIEDKPMTDEDRTSFFDVNV
jgi:hypothetical protein